MIIIEKQIVYFNNLSLFLHFNYNSISFFHKPCKLQYSYTVTLPVRPFESKTYSGFIPGAKPARSTVPSLYSTQILVI